MYLKLASILPPASASPYVRLLPAWENERMLPLPQTWRSMRAKASLVVFLVVALAISTWMAPPHDLVLHNILHHLNILPFMLAGLFFGWRGALRTVLLAAILQAPTLYRHWSREPLDAQDQIVEVSIFGTAGVIAGLLSDRERMQRKRVEQTKIELESVYTELRENIEQLKKTERLSVAGQLSSSLAHEIRNPLASISGAAGILARGQASPEARAECLEILTKESQRLNKLLTNFLDFARPRLPRLQRTEPLDIVQSVTTLAQHIANREGVSLDLKTSPHLREVECDAEQIKQLLLNLILNAIQATGSNGVVTIHASSTESTLTVEVRDQGRGIDPEQRVRIFDPFFTTKENGTGLGLAIASNIAAQHGGSLTFQPNAPHGSIFRMELPAAANLPARTSLVEQR